MSERKYEFRRRMCRVHEPCRRMEHAVKQEGGIEIDGGWSITLEDIADRVLYNAARDLEDYFAVSMGVFVGFNRPSDKKLIYRVDPSLDGAFSVSVSEDSVVLSGGDARLCARAGYLLEDLCSLAEAPFLKKGVTLRRPLYSPRMVHSGYAIDEFPDDYLNKIAHAGFTAILIYVKDTERSRSGYTDFDDLVYRAAGYGLDVYAYSELRSGVYPEGEDAQRFYDSLYGEFFRRHPGVKGIVFVGESVEFPSRDPHTSGMSYRDNRGPDGKKLIDKPNPGWWPCDDFYKWIGMVKTSIRAEKPDADIVVWSYNWGYVEEKYRIALIDSLPTDVSLLVTFEMFEDLTVDGVKARTVDYSLFFEGPGKYFISEAKAAKRRGIRLYAMTNTGGLCWDVGVIPFMPAPGQWQNRYAAMRRAHDEWGLCGLMESHHYGWYPSFISDLARFTFDDPGADPAALLYAIAVRDFSEQTADRVLEAYRLFSEGSRRLVSTSHDQYGPMRIGPAYPLLLENTDYEFCTSPTAHHRGNSICKPVYKPRWKFGVADEEAQLRGEMRLYEKSAELFDGGADFIDEVIGMIHPSKRAQAKRLSGVARFIARTALTAVNIKEWYLLKKELDAAENKRECALKMKAVAEREIENALAAIPLVEYDSRLGYEPSMEYMADAERIGEKIGMLRRVISEELSAYL